MRAEQIGIALRGRRNGNGWLVRCPCPNHGKGKGDRNPSLSVTDSDDGRLLLLCFAGCEFTDILDELRDRRLVEDKEAVQSARVERVEHIQSADALIIWRASEPLPGTIAAEYLERRGIILQRASLRSRIGKRAMVAGVQSSDGKIIAVQTTILTAQAEKASGTSRITTGALGNGAVRFAPASEVMGLAEGVETALSAQMWRKYHVGHR